MSTHSASGNSFIYSIGYIWSALIQKNLWLPIGHRFVRGHDIRMHGLENIAELAGETFLLIPNHVPVRDVLWPKVPFSKKFKRFSYPVDSFIWHRMILEEFKKELRVVASCDRGFWSEDPRACWFEKNVLQDFNRGRLEGMGYIALSRNPGSFNRSFLTSVERTIEAREPILLFPEGVCHAEFDPNRKLEMGAAHLARKYQLPIVPAYIRGGSHWNPTGPTDLFLGKPIDPKGLSKTQIGRLIAEKVYEIQMSVTERLVDPKASSVKSDSVKLEAEPKILAH